MQKLFLSNVLLCGVMPHMSTATEATAKQELLCVLMQKSIPSPFIFIAEFYYLT